MSPAHADLLQLGGDYGDARGCRFLKINDYGEETMLALTGDGYQSYVTACEFLQVLTARNGERVVTSLCSSEGDAEKAVEFVRIVRLDNADAYQLYGQNGDLLGEVERCPR